MNTKINHAILLVKLGMLSVHGQHSTVDYVDQMGQKDKEQYDKKKNYNFTLEYCINHNTAIVLLIQLRHVLKITIPLHHNKNIYLTRQHSG